MRDFLRRISLPLLFGALLLTTVVFMLGDRPAERAEDRPWPLNLLLELVAPVQAVLVGPIDWVSGTWSDYVDLVDLHQENLRLDGRLAELEEQNLQLREALVASGHLERIVAMRQNFEVPLLPTEVVGQDLSPWFRSVLLDRGRRDQVHSGMPVVAAQGLAGLITASSPHAARAMVLLDRRSAVDAIVERSRARGIVRGRGSGELEFVFMVRGDDVNVGDALITSGVGGVYPKGLRIGRVDSVNTDRSELLHTAGIEPAVDFGRLEQVFVVLQRGPTMDLLYEGEGDVPAAPEPAP